MACFKNCSSRQTKLDTTLSRFLVALALAQQVVAARGVFSWFRTEVAENTVATDAAPDDSRSFLPDHCLDSESAPDPTPTPFAQLEASALVSGTRLPLQKPLPELPVFCQESRSASSEAAMVGGSAAGVGPSFIASELDLEQNKFYQPDVGDASSTTSAASTRAPTPLLLSSPSLASGSRSGSFSDDGSDYFASPRVQPRMPRRLGSVDENGNEKGPRNADDGHEDELEGNWRLPPAMMGPLDEFRGELRDSIFVTAPAMETEARREVAAEKELGTSLANLQLDAKAPDNTGDDSASKAALLVRGERRGAEVFALREKSHPQHAHQQLQCQEPDREVEAQAQMGVERGVPTEEEMRRREIAVAVPRHWIDKATGQVRVPPQLRSRFFLRHLDVMNANIDAEFHALSIADEVDEKAVRKLQRDTLRAPAFRTWIQNNAPRAQLEYRKKMEKQAFSLQLVEAMEREFSLAQHASGGDATQRAFVVHTHTPAFQEEFASRGGDWNLLGEFTQDIAEFQVTSTLPPCEARQVALKRIKDQLAKQRAKAAAAAAITDAPGTASAASGAMTLGEEKTAEPLTAEQIIGFFASDSGFLGFPHAPTTPDFWVRCPPLHAYLTEKQRSVGELEEQSIWRWASTCSEWHKSSAHCLAFPWDDYRGFLETQQLHIDSYSLAMRMLLTGETANLLIRTGRVGGKVDVHASADRPEAEREEKKNQLQELKILNRYCNILSQLLYGTRNDASFQHMMQQHGAQQQAAAEGVKQVLTKAAERESARLTNRGPRGEPITSQKLLDLLQKETSDANVWNVQHAADWRYPGVEAGVMKTLQEIDEAESTASSDGGEAEASDTD